MARSERHIILNGLHGAIGKTIVVKQYGKKTVVTKYPDMTNVVASKLQIEKRNLFKEAVAYAKGIIKYPVLKTAYIKKVKRGQTVYHYALREYLTLAKKQPN